MNFLDKQTYDKIKLKRICVLTGIGGVNPSEEYDFKTENDTFFTSKKIYEMLIREKFKFVEYLTFQENNLNELKKVKADVFVNLTEGQRFEFCNRVTDYLDKLGVPYTGSGRFASETTTDKFKTKQILLKNNVLTPKGFVINFENLDKIKLTQTDFPLIIKPRFEDGSVGVTQKSVVKNEKELKITAKKMLDEFKEDLLVEEFIEAREITVTNLEFNGEIVTLPISELIYLKTKRRRWNIYTYDSKWSHSSSEYSNTIVSCPIKNLSSKDLKNIEDLCKKVFKLFQFHDYSRIDIRLENKTNTPYFIDINSNPSLEIGTKDALITAVLTSKMKLSHFVALIIKNAMERYGKKI